jgi:hypothetical protein
LLAALTSCDREKPDEVKKISATYTQVLQNQEAAINP